MTTLRIGFAGTPDFAALHLKVLLESAHDVAAVLTQPDRRSGRGKKAHASPIKVMAGDAGIDVLQPASLKTVDAQTDIAALELDALVVVAYGLLLPQAVLDLPRFGCLNVHGSLLPRWRGAAPIQRAVEAGDSESGVTIMAMDAGLDTGPMLAHRSCPIPPLCTSGDLYDRLGELGPDLLLAVLEDLPGHLERAVTQDDAQATHAAKISKQEACIDWEESAAVLARRIRAFNPAPGCYSFLKGQRIKLWAATPMPAGLGATPGEIVTGGDNRIVVSCGDGALALDSLQLPGARALSSAEVLRGRGELFAPGEIFSSDDNP